MLLNRHEEGWRFWMLVTGLVLTFLTFSSSCQAQALGVNYSWSDSILVNTGGRDSTFATIWESVNIWFRGGEGYVRFGAPDTTGWNSRKFVRLADNQILGFDAGTKLRRLQFKAATGTATIYFAGYKKRRQF
jgi:hypothetical protein